MKTGAYMQYGLVEKLGWESLPSGARDHTPMLDKSMIQGSTTAVQIKKGNFTMKRLQILPLLFGLFFAATAGVVNAQSAGDKAGATLTRAQVKMERDEFLKSHQYDSVTDNWVMKPGVEPPAGMKSRAEVKAERDQFLRNNRWDPVTDTWVSMKGAPRDLGTLSRAQVRADTAQFVRTHRWDPVTDTWVEKKAASGTKK